MTVGRLRRGDTTLAYADPGGPAPPMVLLHGLAGHRGEWDAVTAALAGQARAVTLDQRGHGASTARPGDVSRAAFVADVVALIAHLRLPPVVLVGQSMGGAVALRAAAGRPDLVRGLVLVEASPAAGTPDDRRRVADWLASWPVPFATRAQAAEFFGGGPVGAGWAAGLARAADGWRPRFDRQVLAAVLADDGDAWAEWAALPMPVLVVLAEHGIVGAADEAAMRGAGREVVRLPGVGHDLHLADPAGLAALLLRFPSRHPV
ncbi:alpha/beta fold hydrolase [Asanoa sp. WMMD1127]|uniref:alpha/beta fold hydrolase n=1 Tax=Asanoa sp. WMMD1127 TaxID=3016107 RepID=UPI0024162202|nr:alpha/beta fold hydrolase [Asanoa sp. WMMD1127]MDG4823211.1 alpha/beta fold hydrolase [Asanoa sp. WMMD1127]